jgi:hypothetical protein
LFDTDGNVRESQDSVGIFGDGNASSAGGCARARTVVASRFSPTFSSKGGGK